MKAENTKPDYTYNLFVEGNSAAAKIIRLVGQEKKVLEIGAGPGSITKVLTNKNSCSVIAIEIDEKSISELEHHCKKVYRSDLNNTKWVDELSDEGLFDVVVATDVLEHLYDPWQTLQLIGKLLSQNGYILLSIPHVSHAVIMACLADNDFAYSETGLLDKTHIRFFGIKNMEQLVSDAGMKIIGAEFVVKQPEDTEFARKWSKLSINSKEAFTQHKFSNVYQVIIKAVPIERSEKKISLHSLSISDPKPSTQQKLIRIARKILPEKTLTKIKSKLNLKSRY